MRWTRSLGGHVNALISSAQVLVVSRLGGLFPWLARRLGSTASGPTLFRPTNPTTLFTDATETTLFHDRTQRLTYSAMT